MTDHYQGNIFTEYTALKTQREKNTLNDGKSIRLGQQNMTLSHFSTRAAGKEVKERRFLPTMRRSGFYPSLMSMRPGVNCYVALPNFLGSFKGE